MIWVDFIAEKVNTLIHQQSRSDDDRSDLFRNHIELRHRIMIQSFFELTGRLAMGTALETVLRCAQTTNQIGQT